MAFDPYQLTDDEIKKCYSIAFPLSKAEVFTDRKQNHATAFTKYTQCLGLETLNIFEGYLGGEFNNSNEIKIYLAKLGVRGF